MKKQAAIRSHFNAGSFRSRCRTCAAAPQWPSLAGQHENYLQVALERYKTGQRVDLVMNPLIAALDEQSIEELAAFFAAQPHLYNTVPTDP